MRTTVQKMEAQLQRWHSKIETLVAKSLAQRAPSGFDTLTYIDELKVLHAIALLKLDELKAASDLDRERCEVGAENALDELEAMIKKPPGSP